MALTPKQQMFVLEYIVDLNGTQAAIRAGYSVKTACEQAARLLANVKIQEAIQKAMEERSRRTEITADMVLNELAKIAFSNLHDYSIDDNGRVDIQQSAQPGAIRAVSSIKRKVFKNENGQTIETELKLWSKPQALELIGRHLKMFTDKKELSGEIGITITPDDAEL